MIEYKNEIQNFYDLIDLCWSGALDRLKEIEELDLGNEFMSYLEDICSCYDEPMTLCEINDFIWFECDEWIDEHKQELEDEEE